MSQNTSDKALVSNGYILSTESARLGRLEASDPAWSVSRLQEQYVSQGYLWLKGLLNRAEVMNFRRWYFTLFKDTGLLADGSDPMDGIYAGDSNGKLDSIALHRITVEAVRQSEYAAFCQATPIVKFYETFLGGPVHLYQRKLIRFTRPNDLGCTGAHYDMVYLRQGSDKFCSSWIPIGDIPVEMGGLIYMEGSHQLGYQLENGNVTNADAGSSWLSKDLPTLAERANRRWLVADYEAGDMVVHSPYIIHASTMNANSSGCMRLSTDIRYQRTDARVDSRWGNDWSPDDML